MILASACLCALTAIQRGNNRHPVFKELMDKGKLVLVCRKNLAAVYPQKSR
jgi:hypothetical protein